MNDIEVGDDPAAIAYNQINYTRILTLQLSFSIVEAENFKTSPKKRASAIILIQSHAGMMNCQQSMLIVHHQYHYYRQSLLDHY